MNWTGGPVAGGRRLMASGQWRPAGILSARIQFQTKTKRVSAGGRPGQMSKIIIISRSRQA